MHTIFALILSFTLVNCGGPRAFTKGEYDDPTRTELLDDKFNENDMQQMAETIIKAMTSCRAVLASSRPPFVIVESIANRTQEHIDMKSLQDKIQTALIKSERLKFLNKSERTKLEEEYDYNSSGAVSQTTRKSRGKQIGADYLLSGILSTNVQEVGSDKFVYYKLTMNLTNLETSTIDCTEEKEIRKRYEKRSIRF
jgi:uncharacterized protein (TIGR02722 family)